MEAGKVSVIIPTRGKVGLVKNCLKALFRAIGKQSVDVLVLEQGGEDSKEMIAAEFAGEPVSWMVSEEGWSYSEINNAGVAATDGEFVLLLNNDTIPRSGFLAAMLKQMVDPQVGIVGAKLLFPTHQIQHIGIVFKNDGVPYHIGYQQDDDGTLQTANRTDDYDAATFACALIRRSVWEELGGLDPIYFFNYEDVDFCLRAREKGYRIPVAHEAVVVHFEGKSSDDRQTDKHSKIENLKIFGARWIAEKAQDGSCRLERATGLRLRRDAATFRHERRNIAFIPQGRKAGVPWWRIEQPAKKMTKAELANIVVLYGDMAEGQLKEALENADLAVFQGFAQDWAVKIAEMGGLRSWPFVYDYDDHPIHISPFSQAYRVFGCQEIKLRSNVTGKEFYLWRDGEHGFDLKKNLESRANQLKVFAAADLVTTSTVPLYNYLKTLNQNVVVLPNGIDFTIFRHPFTLFERKPGPVRIGWHGGDNHFHDIQSIGSEIVKFVNGHDNIQLVLFGAFYRGALEGIDESKVVEEEWVDIEAFPWKLQTLGIDVAIIPLADGNEPHMRFNDYKSDIKFLEYGAMRIPSLVAANRPAYAACMDGENALTYSGAEEFHEKLDLLVRDADFRKALGQRALDWVHEYRDLDKMIHRWMTAYENAIDAFKDKRQAALDEVEAQKTEELGSVVPFPGRVADAIDAAVPDSALEPAASNAVQEGS